MKTRDVIQALQARGAMHTRTNGSHRRFESACGRCFTTVSGKPGDDVPTGTARKIERDMTPGTARAGSAAEEVTMTKRKTQAKNRGAQVGTVARGLGRYTAVYERDPDGTWIVEVKEARHCHTYGDSLSRARAKIRTALALWFDDAARAQITDDVRLPAPVKHQIHSYREARAAADRAAEKASQSSREAVRLLRKLGISTRDAAEVMGLSQQRIAQLVS